MACVCTHSIRTAWRKDFCYGHQWVARIGAVHSRQSATAAAAKAVRETRSTVSAVKSENPKQDPSRRTGVLALKLGMTQVWNNEGNSIAVTLLQVVENEVVKVRSKEKDGYTALQIGAFNHPKAHKISKAVLGQFEKAGVVPKRKLAEFRITEDTALPVGTKVTASHFVAGQYVDVCGTSIGKGFQGVMKRHGMKGQPASHGTTLTHRKMGGTGGAQDPGRVWPGKRMAGRMGGVRVTTQSLKIWRINHRFGVLYVNGAVPGHKNSVVRVTDAKRRPHECPGPVPTASSVPEGPVAEETYAPEAHPPHAPMVVFADKSASKKNAGKKK